MEIAARDDDALRRLRDFGFDLFAPTARRAADGFAIDGLVTLDEAARMVAGGYPVLLVADAGDKARGHLEVSEFSEWIAERLAERQA